MKIRIKKKKLKIQVNFKIILDNVLNSLNEMLNDSGNLLLIDDSNTQSVQINNENDERIKLKDLNDELKQNNVINQDDEIKFRELIETEKEKNIINKKRKDISPKKSPKNRKKRNKLETSSKFVNYLIN